MNKTSTLINLIFICAAFAQTTGKISGNIKDEDSNEPLIAANVIVKDSNLGAATDVDGYYAIVNIKPGLYTLIVDMIGYKQLVLENVRVSVNRTTTIDASLSPTVIQGETVTVEVDAITAKKDQTSTIKNISLSTRNLFSDKIGKTIIKTHIVGVIRNKEVLFLNSIFSSFFIMYFLII